MTPRPRKAVKRWSFSVGEAPHTVYVFERTPGGMLYMRVWNAVEKKKPKRSLKHRDREEAKREALALHQRLVAGVVIAEPSTLGPLLDAYLRHATPKKVATSQADDHRRAAMWERLFGRTRKIATLGRAEWESFIRERMSGAIDAHGDPVTYVLDGKRNPVGPRTADADLVFLVAVFNWALSWNGIDGRPMLKENPWGAAAPGVKRALERPKPKTVHRPIVTFDRYLKVRAVADQVRMQCRRGDDGAELVTVGAATYRGTVGPTKKWMRRSYLPELLELVEQTGRRITSVCRLTAARLQWGDVLDAGRTRRGIIAVAWPPLKGDLEDPVPVSPETRATLERVLAQRPVIGERCLFPSPKDASRPIDKRLATTWLHAAETLAGVTPIIRGAWHPYRRKWSTERKHLPIVDVMRASSRRDERSLKESYIQSDDATVLEVVLTTKKLRDRSG